MVFVNSTAGGASPRVCPGIPGPGKAAAASAVHPAQFSLPLRRWRRELRPGGRPAGQPPPDRARADEGAGNVLLQTCVKHVSSCCKLCA